MLLLGLSTGQKLGLGLVAGAFVVFALAVAVWLPRYRPDFPGRSVRLFVLVAVAFTIGTLAAVVFFAKESEEEAEAAHTGQVVETGTAGETAPPAPAPRGDPAAGKVLFASQGCAACHRFTPAGSSGTIGPSLDSLAADAEAADRGSLEEYARESIEDPGAYLTPSYENAMAGAFPKLSESQVDDLVAFLLQ